MRKSRGKYDAQAVADIPIRRKTAQLHTQLAVYDGKGVGRRPFVEGLPITDLVALINDELDARAMPDHGHGGGSGSTTVVLAGEFVCDVLTLTGTSATLSSAPVAPSKVICFVVMNEGPDLPLAWKSSSPGANEFTIAGDALEVGTDRADSNVRVFYTIQPRPLYYAEFLTSSYPSFTATLTIAPSDPEKSIILWQLDEGPALPLSWKSSTPGPNEFTISGTTITLGRQMTRDGQVLAHYPISV